jgi:hypothetical protein
MTHRETWEETSFQVFTDEDGVLRSGYYPTGEGTVTGNVQVDFAWGNFPMQPDDDRTDSYIGIPAVQDVGWSTAFKVTSDTLRTADYNVELNNLEAKVPADSHTIATLGYSNFPAYIENYAGDEDPELEQVVPNLIGKTLAQATYALDKLNLDLFARGHNIDITSIVSDGKTVRVYANDTDYWDNDAALVGLKAGDKVWVDNDLYDFGDLITITKVNADGEDSWIEFETATDLNLDDTAAGNVWQGPDSENVITLQRFWNEPGSIKDEGTNIHVRYLNVYDY